LVLENLPLGAGGVYMVAAVNWFGGVSNAVAAVSVWAPRLEWEPGVVEGAFRLWLPGLSNLSLTVESSADLRTWTPYYQHPAQPPALYLDVPVTNSPRRFFRARP
jgi:hypothetical protein